MFTCEDTMLDSMVQPPSCSRTTAAEVSSHDVSIPSMFMDVCVRLASNEGRQGRAVRRFRDSLFRNDAGDVLVRRDVEGGIARLGGLRGHPCGPDVRDFLLVALFDRDACAVGRGQIDGGDWR